LTDEKFFGFFSGQKSILPIVEIVFPQSVYLFHGTIPNNAGGGGETTFAIAVIHHQNSSKALSIRRKKTLELEKLRTFRTLFLAKTRNLGLAVNRVCPGKSFGWTKQKHQT
jgi:hypothetical protein